MKSGIKKPRKQIPVCDRVPVFQNVHAVEPFRLTDRTSTRWQRRNILSSLLKALSNGEQCQENVCVYGLVTVTMVLGIVAVRSGRMMTPSPTKESRRVTPTHPMCVSRGSDAPPRTRS
jgi:hypothetical protein